MLTRLVVTHQPGGSLIRSEIEYGGLYYLVALVGFITPLSGVMVHYIVLPDEHDFTDGTSQNYVQKRGSKQMQPLKGS